ncbi:MAG: sigma-70 family RNA polymerase sigma factor [Chitinophagaceae bacterium]
MNHLTDKQLIQQYLEGDARSLGILVNRYKTKIFTSIYLLVKDKYVAEDIFQDTFIKVIDTLRLEKYTDEGKFANWVTRIAHNLCVDHFRKTKHRSFIKSTDNIELYEHSGIKSNAVDHNIEWRESTEAVQNLLDRLPEEQRVVIILRHYADLSFAKIAVLNNCSINTALGRMRYGLINLRKLAGGQQLSFS